MSFAELCRYACSVQSVVVPDETKWIKDNAAQYAAQKEISVDQAISDLTAQANR